MGHAVRPEEKKSHALPRTWAYSDWFFDTLASTHISVSKVVAVMVEVLTGLDIELAGREGLQYGDFGGDYRSPFIRLCAVIGSSRRALARYSCASAMAA